MKIPKHREQSLIVLARLAGWGFSPEVQQRIGVLSVVWDLFESNLEPTLSALRDEKVAGVGTSIGNMVISEFIAEMAKGSAKLATEDQDVFRLAGLAAKDLMEYRHALVHGRLIPFPTMPTFILNPRRNGKIRNPPCIDAHVDENLLDMAIDAAWTLCRVACAARAASTDRGKTSSLTALKSEVARAKSQANELRYLTTLMNHEKY